MNWHHIASTILLHNFSFATKPFKYFLVVTKSCGSRCTNCLIWKEVPENELSLSEFELLAKKSSSNLVWLNLSGGEPTDRDDFIKIIDLFVQNCPNMKILNFTTNGLNPEKLKDVCEYLNKSPISVIGLNVSIDGPPLIHNRLRGTEDGFTKAIEALRIVRSYPRIKSAAAMTLFPSNYKHVLPTLESITKHFEDFTLKDLHLNFPHASSHYYGNETINYKDRLNLEDVIPYFKNSFSLFTPFEMIESIYQKYLVQFSKTGVTPFKCAAIKSNIYISEKGDVYPCTIWDKKLGSLRENEFDIGKILKTNLARETREKIIKKKCPNCWTPCEAFPSIITDLKKITSTPL